MTRKQTEEPNIRKATFEEDGVIQVRVSDFDNGLRVYDGIKLIRMKSKDYTLLIMEDYFPQIGAINGQIELVTKDDQISLGNVKGFFMHRDNEFVLLIEEQLKAREMEA